MVTTLLYSIAGGTLTILATGGVTQIAWRFLRLICTIAFALVAAAAAWEISRGGWLPGGLAGAAQAAGLAGGAGAGLLLMLAPVAGAVPRTYRGGCALAGLAAICAACLHGLMLAPQRAGLASAGIVIGQVIGAAMAGSITVAWMLGHAYLTATSMTIAPLRHFSRMLSVTVMARAAFFAASLLVAWAMAGGTPGGPAQGLWDYWIVVALRAGVGLLAVGVFAYMVADCVRLRATQSATGILYFGSVLAYMGELAALYLVMQVGWAT